MANKDLQKAKRDKRDEFYTQLVDIEKEMKYYRRHFKEKIVLCNCDDPYESNFFKYFTMNFNALGLKKLICIGYKDSPVSGEQISLFDEGEPSPAHVLEITEVADFNEDGRTDLSDVEWLLKNNNNVYKELKGNGDFRSDESIAYLKQADIVVTNPPFSLFREYIAQLLQYGKDFIILGNQNAVTYKEVFPLIQNNRIWLGHYSGDMAFKVPSYYEPRKTRYWEDETGQKWRSLGNICWYTNIDFKQRHEGLTLYKKYDPAKYPKYDNYDAIEVGKTKEIPCDYDGIMGVPITFLDKFDPDQFEILGIMDRQNTSGLRTKKYTKSDDPNFNDLNARGVLLIDGRYKAKYARLIIKRK